MAGFALDDRQRRDWLRLIRSESIGPRSFQALLNRFGGAARALEALPDLARRSGKPLRICTEAEAERELDGLDRLGARLIALGEGLYPAALRAIDSAPPLLAMRGDPAVLARPCIAIVGSRNASAAGQKFTARLARDFAEAGFAVVSGLARGIDTAAHGASRDLGTIAVLAGGMDEVYPPQNIPLLEDLLGSGAALSEMPLGWAPRGRDFPRRNRLVSGLALGTVVVEAARRSGSLITARFANEQGRHVFAVPGSPLDPRAEGANDLLRQGAILCASSEHVIEVLAPLVGRQEPFAGDGFAAGAASQEADEYWDELDLPAVLDGAEAAVARPPGLRPPALPAGGAIDLFDAPAQPSLAPRDRILALLGSAPILPDDLVRASGEPARDVARIVLELEMERLLLRHPGGTVSRA